MSRVSVAGRKTRYASISAEVVRKDGTRRNIGVVSFTHANPLIHYPMQAWIRVKRRWMGI